MLELAADLVKEALADHFERQEAGEVFGLRYESYNPSDETLEKVEALQRALVERRLASARSERIRKLENVTGRTPEETALYLAKAKELRRG